VNRIEREWMAKIPRPAFKVLIDHIDHIAKVAGVEHVGLGSDFDGVSGATPQGMDSAADLPKITQALLDRDTAPTTSRKFSAEICCASSARSKVSAAKCRLTQIEIHCRTIRFRIQTTFVRR